jgi:hypothetical protein
MVKIEIFGAEAIIDGYQWSCQDATIERMLNTQLDPSGPSGTDPDRDNPAAQADNKRYGGRIVSSDKPDSPKGTFY